jgi:hypothetical protein
MNNSPALWDKLLKQVPKGSALMGGAVVDYLIGAPVNDYDIFYAYHPGEGWLFPGNWVMTKANFNDPVWIKEHEEMYLQGIDEFGNHPISSVIEYLVDGEHKVQMIGVNYDNPIKHLKNFDHSLTLASYDAKGMFVHKKVFQSYESKVIEYVSKNLEQGAVVKSLARAHKKAAKFGIEHDWQYKGFIPKPKVALGGIFDL